MLAWMWRKGNLCVLLVEIKIGAVTMESSLKVPQKIIIELPYNSAIPLLGIYPKKTKTPIGNDTYSSMFITALFTIAKTWKQSVHQWMNG